MEANTEQETNVEQGANTEQEMNTEQEAGGGQAQGGGNRVNGLAVAGLVFGIAAIPLICVNYIGILAGIIGFILSYESVTGKRRENVSKVSAVAIALNLLAVAAGFTMLVIARAALKQSLPGDTSMEVTSVIHFFNIYR